MTRQSIDFGIMLNGPGSHMHAWKSPEVPSDASTNFDFQLKIARKAEDAGFSFYLWQTVYIYMKNLYHIFRSP